MYVLRLHFDPGMYLACKIAVCWYVKLCRYIGAYDTHVSALCTYGKLGASTMLTRWMTVALGARESPKGLFACV